jgi:predicted permease
MSNFAMIVICLLAGFFLRVFNKLPAEASRVLNTVIIYLSFPALVLVQAPELFTSEALRGGHAFVPVSMAWILLAVGTSLFIFIGRRLRWEAGTVGALALTVGFSNTSFVGFPVLEALLGQGSLKVAIVVDQAGTFLALSTVGLALAAYFSGAKASIKDMAKRVFHFPPFIALLVSAALFAGGVTLPAQLIAMLERLSHTLVPLALVSVGSQLKLDRASLKEKWSIVTIGLVFKLAIAPLLLATLYIGLIGERGYATQVTLLESAMAPMITGAIVSADFGLDVEAANLLVGIGIPLSLLSVPVVYWLTQLAMG